MSSKGEKSCTDNLIFRGTATYDDILEKATKIYFPKGKSKKGRKEKLELLLGTAKGEVIDREGFSLDSYVQKLHTQQKRIYLLSKAQYTLINISTEEDSDWESLPDINFSKRPKLSTEISNQLQSFNFPEFVQSNDLVTSFEPDPHLQPDPTTLQPDASPSQPVAHIQQAELVQQATPSQPVAPIQQAEPIQPATPSQPVAPIQQAEPIQPATPYRPAVIPLQLNAGTPDVSFNITTCCICFDRDRNTALIPCGHMFCCVCALAQLHSGNRNCPLCRKYISNTLEMLTKSRCNVSVNGV